MLEWLLSTSNVALLIIIFLLRSQKQKVETKTKYITYGHSSSPGWSESELYRPLQVLVIATDYADYAEWCEAHEANHEFFRYVTREVDMRGYRGPILCTKAWLSGPYNSEKAKMWKAKEKIEQTSSY